MSKIKSLNQIRLPRVSDASDFLAHQSEEVNNNRLNQNFRNLFSAVVALEDFEEGIDKRINNAIPQMAARVVELGTDGIWSWRKWSDGLIEAWVTSVTAALSCTTASGSMFVASHTISLPTGLFSSVSSVSATPICSTNYIASCVKSITASTMSLAVMCSVSASVNVTFGISVIGK